MLPMRRLAVVVVVVLLGGGLPLSAEPLKPGDVLRLTFNLSGLLDANQDLPIETFDALEFIPGANEVEPVGSVHDEATRLRDTARHSCRRVPRRVQVADERVQSGESDRHRLQLVPGWQLRRSHRGDDRSRTR